MSLNRFGALPEKPWHASVIAGKLSSALRKRELQKTGLTPFVEFDWTPLVYPAYQVGNSCLTFSACQDTWLWLQLHDFHPTAFPDAMAPYWYARRRRTTKPTDSGAYAGDAWWAIANYSVSPMPHEPGDQWALAELTEPPNAARDFAGVDVTVKSNPIYDSGTALVDRIFDSCALKRPVQICLPVEASILDAANESVVEAPKVPMRIGHAMAVVGGRKVGAERQLKCCTNWRGNRFLWIPESYAGQAYSVRDVSSVVGWY